MSLSSTWQPSVPSGEQHRSYPRRSSSRRKHHLLGNHQSLQVSSIDHTLVDLHLGESIIYFTCGEFEPKVIRECLNDSASIF